MSDFERLDAVPTPVRDVRAEQVDGELLLYHPKETRAIYLNGPAAVIWGLCDGQRKVGEMLTLLVESYPEAQGSLRTDVLEAVDRLIEAGVLRTGAD